MRASHHNFRRYTDDEKKKLCAQVEKNITLKKMGVNEACRAAGISDNAYRVYKKAFASRETGCPATLPN